MSFTIEVGGMTASYAGAASLSPQRLEILLALAGGLSVIDRVQTGPPRRPGVGYRYIVASPAEDEWAGQEGRVAVWVGDAWAFLNPAEGLSAWDEDAAETIQYSSSAWAASGGGGGGGAPTTAEYVVTASNGSLSAERVTTNTATVEWDTGTAGQLKANVPDGSVTYAKVQDVSAASKILGRGDSGSGDVQEITLGTNLSMSGTTLNATGGGGVSLAEVRKIASLRL